MSKQTIPLSRSKHTDLVYLIKGSAYPWLYSKLTQILSAEEIRYFASVETRQTEGRWSAFHEGDFVPYTKAPEADKEFVTDDLNYLHTVVRRKIIADPEMKKYVDDLLLIPSQEQIFVYHDESGMPKITLAQWGCSQLRSKHGFDPVGLILEERKKTHTMVNFSIKWTNGEPAADTEFKFAYKYSVVEKTTDAGGLARLGLLKHGAEFTVSGIAGAAAFEEIFEVVPEQTLYSIAIPYYTSVEVKVIDQLKQPVAGCEVRAIHAGDDRTCISDEQGEFRIDKILHDDNSLILSLLPGNKINKEYILEREQNRLTFEIFRIITGNVHIKVVNRFDNKPVAGHVIKVKPVDGEENEFTAGDEGRVTIAGIERSTCLTVIDASDKYNYKDFTVNADNEEFVFPVELPVILSPYIRVVNRKDKIPVGAYPLKVKTGDNEQELYSNREGIVAFEGGLEQGVKILVTDANDRYNNAEFTVVADSLELVFEVELPEDLSLRIKVVNRSDGEPAGAYPLKVRTGDSEQELYSNREGIVILNQLKKDAKLSIVDGNNSYNNAEFTFDAGGTGEYLFPVELPEEKMVKINFVYSKNRGVVPGHIVDVIINGVHYKRTTDEEGKISLPASLFTHGKKVKVKIPVTGDDRDKLKEKGQ